ncbi:mechanosensitive ion channel family protein [Ruminococcus sp.]|uniref:mechanosensitive ion channel family protein n=1 Tax=Ruminococcus sp. TaxID=41978 RepID=UPI00386BC1CB
MESIKEMWNRFTSSIINYLPDLGGALVITVIGIIISLIAVSLTRKAMQRKKVDPSLVAFITRCVRLLIYAFTLLAAMSALHISITGIVAFFSAAAAAVALALKDRLNDIASGIVILFTKPFVTGDFIEFSKYSGFVQKIDVMHTNIRTYGGTNVIIPNSVISNAEVNNYTTHPQIRVNITVPVPYDADIKQVQQILAKVIEDTDHVLDDESYPKTVRLEKFGDSALEFSVRCYCEYKDYWTVYYALMEGIKNSLDQNKIAIPYNQLDVHVVSNTDQKTIT